MTLNKLQMMQLNAKLCNFFLSVSCVASFVVLFTFRRYKCQIVLATPTKWLVFQFLSKIRSLWRPAQCQQSSTPSTCSWSYKKHNIDVYQTIAPACGVDTAPWHWYSVIAGQTFFSLSERDVLKIYIQVKDHAIIISYCLQNYHGWKTLKEK